MTDAARAREASRDTSDPAALEAFVSRFKDSFKQLKDAKVVMATPPSPPAARCDGIETRVGSERRCLHIKDTFKDCANCPQMVVVPAGRFTMGSPSRRVELTTKVHSTR
jgi:formylglycine-generating enzyme required for sulfatase activity